MTMETRTLGKTGLEVGVLGLGVEHLDTNRENMDAVFDLAVPSGVNYYDLVYNDPLDAHSEHWETIGPAIRRHRQHLVLTAHWGFVAHEPIDHCALCFDAVLDRLGNGYADIAMLTMVDTEPVWTGWAQESIERLHQYQRDGRVGFIGLSNHDVDVARMAVESGLIDVLMFPVNLYQHHGHPEREALLECCAENGVGVVAMKAYYGGRLLETDGRPTGINPAQCLHYVRAQSVATIVPGVRNSDEMRQTLRYLGASVEEKQFAPLHDELVDRLGGQCVLCQHCLPCPVEIPIPTLISCVDYVAFQEHGLYHEDFNRKLYASLQAQGSDCIACEECLERCPFDVDIIGKMHQAVELFESGA